MHNKYIPPYKLIVGTSYHRVTNGVVSTTIYTPIIVETLSIITTKITFEQQSTLYIKNKGGSMFKPVHTLNFKL